MYKLEEFTYNGTIENELSESAYYCYMIYDKKYNMFYSGSHGVEGRATYDLLDKYFTSSAVTDFRERLKKSSEEFTYTIEYFRTRKLAFEAEANLHQTYNVAKSKYFYNSQNCGAEQNCGAGSTLCRDEHGKIYRVSSKEYKQGNHKHACAGKMVVRLIYDNNRTVSIDKSEFDPKYHLTQFENYVLCKEITTNKQVRIPKEQFDLGKDTKYVGITAGKVSAFDLVENKKCSITQEVFSSNPSRYVGITKGQFPVIDILSGKTVVIKKEVYNKLIHRHYNVGTTTQFSLIAKKNVKITTDEYTKNKGRYANTCTKYFFIVNGTILKNKLDLEMYVQTHYNIKIDKKIKSNELSKAHSFITVISKEQYINGNY